MAQLKPLTAMINDVLAHTFWKVQHLATVHYENGHYHLHSELKTISEEEKNSTQEKGPSSEKSNETNSNQLVNDLNFDIEIPVTYVSQIKDPEQNIVPGFSQINSPPPKQV
jgi:hypothetical protein